MSSPLITIYSKDNGITWQTYSDGNSDMSDGRLINTLFDGRNFVGITDSSLLENIKTLMLGNKFNVNYNYETEKFIISCFADIKILFKTGIASENSIKYLCNFDDSDLTGQVFYSNEVTGIPADVRLACQQIVMALYSMSKEGGGIQMIKQKQMASVGGGGSGTIEYYGDKLPEIALQVLKSKRKVTF